MAQGARLVARNAAVQVVGDTAGKFEGSVVEDEQVNPWGQQNFEFLRSPSAEGGSDIDVGRGPRSVGRLAPMQIREHGPLTAQRLDGLGGSRRDIGHGEIVSSPSACRAARHPRERRAPRRRWRR